MSRPHPLVRLETLALIAVGGFAGVNLRLFALGLVPDAIAIALVNVLGSALLGVLVYEAEYSSVLDRRTRVVFTTGFCSSLTTYSGFAVQTALAADPVWLVGILVGNYGLGFAGVLVGRRLARRLRGAST